MTFKLKVFVLLATVSAMQKVTTASNVSLSLLIALPLHQPSGPRTSWERGLKILPGALQAVNDINKDSLILPGHILKLVAVDSGRDEFEIVQQFVLMTFLQQTNIIGVGGILYPKAIPILLKLVERTGMLLSAITHVDFKLGRFDYSDAFLPLPPASAMASVLLNFIRTMNWKHVGLVTDTKDAYFFSVVQNLMRRAEMNDSLTLSPYIESSYAAYAINRIIKSKVKIIVVSSSSKVTMKLLCIVHKKGLLWPRYAWIFHSFQIEDILEQRSECDIEDAINGVFLVDVQPHSELELMSRMKYNATFRSNGYAELLYDLVWAMAIALNTSLYQNDIYMHRANPQATVAEVLYYIRSFHSRNDWSFRIIHLRNLRQVLISTMQYSNSSITVSSFNSHMLENVPNGELPVVVLHPPFAYTVILGMLIALMTVFVTLTLVLYIYFRKEPEIKATSFALSLLIYLGCYLNLLYLSLLLYAHHTFDSNNIARDNAVCLSLQWLSGPGVPLPLMLATLLVKMLRVYHIFHSTSLRRIGRYCSDLALALYVLLILLPDIFVNFFWTIFDPYQVHLEYRMRDGCTYMEKVCRSNYKKQLFGLLSTYLLILIKALVVVAIITRNVRRQHFKDTKKVNILLFILYPGIIITYCYWALLQVLYTERYIAALSVYIPHSVVIISFQSFLFVPKVVPPLWRHIKTFQLKI